MSKYTTEVRYICEHYAGLDESVGYDSIDDTIQKALPKIFDFDFPIYDEEYRNVLETKIIRHYYTREIGLETVPLWKFKLQTLLNEIMPYYNQRYESALIKFNPLYDTDLTTTNNKTGTGQIDDVGHNTGKGNTTREGDTTTQTTKHGVGTTDETHNDTTDETFEDTKKDIFGETRKGTGNATTDGNTTDNNKQDVTEDTTNKETRDLTTDTKDTGKETKVSSGTNHSQDLYSDTPQGAIRFGDVDEDLEYLTNARIIDGRDSNNTTTDNTDTGNEKQTGTVTREIDGTTTTTQDNKGTSHSETDTTTNEETNNQRDTTDNSTKNIENNGGKNIQNENTETTDGTEHFSENGTSATEGYNTNNRTMKSTEDYILHVAGKQAGVSYSKMLMEFRDTFINIDMEIIRDLAELFMLVW